MVCGVCRYLRLLTKVKNTSQSYLRGRFNDELRGHYLLFIVGSFIKYDLVPLAHFCSSLT